MMKQGDRNMMYEVDLNNESSIQKKIIQPNYWGSANQFLQMPITN